MSSYFCCLLVCWKGSNYERILDIPGAFWCVVKGRIMNDFLIFLVPSGVLKRVKLLRCLDISGAFLYVGKG